MSKGKILKKLYGLKSVNENKNSQKYLIEFPILLKQVIDDKYCPFNVLNGDWPITTSENEDFVFLLRRLPEYVRVNHGRNKEASVGSIVSQNVKFNSCFSCCRQHT